MEKFINKITPEDIKKCNKEEFIIAFSEEEKISRKIKKIREGILELCNIFGLDIKSSNLQDNLIYNLLNSNNFHYEGIGNRVGKIIYNEDWCKKCDLSKINQELIKNKLVELEKKYENSLYYENKTNLPNEKKLRKDIEILEGYKIILLLKIIGFDEINNIYNYEGGNEILNEIIKKINKDLSEYHFKLYRIGGTTFGLLRYCFEDGNKNKIDTLNFVNDYIKEFHIILEEYGDIPIDLKIGGACHENAKLENAKIALSQTKNSGDFLVYDKELENKIHRESKEKMDCKNEIIKALSEGKIIPFFQGIRNNKTGAIEKYESLVRYTKGNEIISPYSFLSIIEGTSIMKDVTKTMIKSTIEIMNNSKYNFSINLTEHDLNDAIIFELIKTELNNNKVNNNRLTIEILEETQGINKNFIKSIKKYKDLGIKIAIDDFGTGFSGFQRVLEAEPDFLKIDGSLIKGITKDIKKWELVHGIVQFAHNMGAEVIAEFVENKEIQIELMKMGVDYSQGYLFSKPSEKIEI